MSFSARGAALEQIGQDFIFGARAQLKTPAVTAAIVVALALGIAGTSASFSLVNGFFLRPPAVVNPAELVRIYPRFASGLVGFTMSYPDYADIRDLTDVFSSALVEEPLPIIVGVSGAYERVWGELVSAGYFQALGVAPAEGRFLDAREDSIPGGEPVAVLGHRWWQRRFGGSRSVLGQTLVVNGHPIKIIGVAPENFHGMILGFQPDVWLPAMIEGALRAGDTLHARGARSVFTIGRLRSGIRINEANAALDVLAGRLQQLYPDSNRGLRFTAFSESEGRVPPMFRSGVLGASGALIAVAGLVLLLACANVAGILLVRAASRRREIGVRLALGATRGRIVRQLMTESASLSLSAGTLGLVLAWATASVLSAAHVPIARGASLAIDFGLDARVIGFSVLVTVLTAVFFGLTPGLEASRLDVVTVLKDGEAPSGLRRSQLRNALVLAQVTLSMVLLISGGLFLQSLRHATRIDLGFDPERVVMTAVDRGPQADADAASGQLWLRLIDRVAAIPRTQSVSLTSRVPLDLGIARGPIAPEGYRPPADGTWPSIEVATVDIGYFSTMRIPLLEGRDFGERDTDTTPPVVIVNDVLAGRFWPDASAVGKRVVVRGGRPAEVIGVVRRSRYLSLGEPPTPHIYFPLRQGRARAMTIVARGTGNPTTYLHEVYAAVHAADPATPLYDVTTMSDHVAVALAPATGGAAVFAIVGVIGLVLTALGLYGTIAQTVSRRTYEIGVRRALGAENGHVAWLVVRAAAGLVLIGLTMGVVLGLIGSRLLRALLFGVETADPLVFGLTPIVLVVVCVVAAAVPTYRAVRINAATALRYE
jgi:predicted permease